MANTLDTQCNQGVVIAVEGDPVKEEHPGLYVRIAENCVVYAVWYAKYECYVAIRKLTPRECFRLQGWSDDYFDKATFVNSDCQLYKQAGNGVTVNVVYDIGCAINARLSEKMHDKEVTAMIQDRIEAEAIEEVEGENQYLLQAAELLSDFFTVEAYKWLLMKGVIEKIPELEEKAEKLYGKIADEEREIQREKQERQREEQYPDTRYYS